MKNIISYKDFYEVLDATQNKKTLKGWENLHKFDNITSNKDFDARVYKRGNKIVICYAGSNPLSPDDLKNDRVIWCTDNIPSQYYDAERLYNIVKNKYPDADIETTGYSLGGTLSNLLSHRTGIRSTVLGPIGSKHIANKHKDYFKYDDSNITTYGRLGDPLFNISLSRQSGKIYIIPDKKGKMESIYGCQHLLGTYEPFDFYIAKPRPTGGAAPISNSYEHIYTPSEIGAMSNDEFTRNESVIMNQVKNGLIRTLPNSINYSGYANPITGTGKIYSREDIDAMSNAEFSEVEKAINAQMKSIGIPSNIDLERASISGGGTIYVNAYYRSDGTYVRGYYRSA